MVEVAEESLVIDHSLRFALFGLESAFGVPFAGAECERVFHDAAVDQVTAKRYKFFESPQLSVTGRVDEYEPESIWVRVEGSRGIGEVLRRVAEGAELQGRRLCRSLETHAEQAAARDRSGEEN